MVIDKKVSVKTHELKGSALDWAFGVAAGWKPTVVYDEGRYFVKDKKLLFNIKPSTCWSLLGQYTHLIAWVESGAGFSICVNDPESKKNSGDPEFRHFGNADHEDFQIALCRAIVDLYLGDTVEVPEVLV